MEPDEHLRAFARVRDNQSFEALVERYSGLVYGIALRKSGDPQMAEEITQNVFVIVAKKAVILASRPAFVGWLHRATTFECSNFLRAESHRRRTMKSYSDQLGRSGGRRHDDEDLLGAVDDALVDLPSSDRLAILYRFFEGRDFKDIGRLLGKSDAAAQKQTRRALEKLAGILRERGIVAPVVTLTSVLTAEFSRAAPAGINASISQQAATAAANSNFNFITFMASNKAIIAAGIVLLVSLVPLSRQHAEIRQLRAERNALWSNHAGTSRSALTLQRRTVPVSSLGSGALPAVDSSMLVKAFLSDSGKFAGVRYSTGMKLAEASKTLKNLSAEELWTMFDEIGADRAGGDVKQGVREWLIRDRLAKLDPSGSLDAAIQFAMREEIFVEVMRDWAAADQTAAQSWLENRRAGNTLEVQRLDGDPPLTALLKGFTEGMAETDLEAALRFVEVNLESEDASALVSGLGRALRQRGDHAAYLRLAYSLKDGGDRWRALSDYHAGILMKPGPPERAIEAAREFLFHSEFLDADRESVLREVAHQMALTLERGAVGAESMLMWMTVRTSSPRGRDGFALRHVPTEAKREALTNILLQSFDEESGGRLDPEVTPAKSGDERS